MKHRLFAVALVFVSFGALAEDDDAKPLEPGQWPTTVEAVVADILAGMPEADKKYLFELPRDQLITLHHGWGTGIRNHYGLWRGNDALIRSACGKPCHPDTASTVIIEKVWDTLQKRN